MSIVVHVRTHLKIINTDLVNQKAAFEHGNYINVYIVLPCDVMTSSSIATIHNYHLVQISCLIDHVFYTVVPFNILINSDMSCMTNAC